MAKVTSQRNHDWIGVKATFPSGHVANVTSSRNGMNVSVTPNDPRAAQTLSIIVDQSRKKVREPGYVASDYGELFDVMAKVGKSATSLGAYLDGLKEALSVTGTISTPTTNAGTFGTAKATKKRGWVVDANFPDGTKIEFTINKSSLGLLMRPEVASNAAALNKMVFGIKQIGVHDDEAIANTLVEAASRSSDVIEWIDNARNAFIAPAPRM